jgi:riboflavin synthase
VAVNGACLTATEVLDGGFSVAAVPETLRRTNLGSLSPGARVNLERAMPAGGRFEGHFVQGHVDATGKVVSAKNDGEERRLAVQVPKRLRRYVVAKGSITIDGVSLTVVRRKKGRLEVALVPHTLDATTLGLRQSGDRVNLEVDMIAKYVESVLKGSS